MPKECRRNWPLLGEYVIIQRGLTKGACGQAGRSTRRSSAHHTHYKRGLLMLSALKKPIGRFECPTRASATKQQDRTGELAPAAARQRERIQPRLSTPRGRLPTPSGRSCGRGEIADRAPAPPTSVNAVAVYRDRKK